MRLIILLICILGLFLSAKKSDQVHCTPVLYRLEKAPYHWTDHHTSYMIFEKFLESNKCVEAFYVCPSEDDSVFNRIYFVLTGEHDPYLRGGCPKQ